MDKRYKQVVQNTRITVDKEICEIIAVKEIEFIMTDKIIIVNHARATLVAQLVKNPPIMQETWVQSLDWKDPLEKGKATHSSILAWRIPWTV